MRKQLLLGALVVATGCSDSKPNVLGGVQSIAYVQRKVGDTGNVFDYTQGGAVGNLFTLTPPTASGVRKNLTNWDKGDVNALDISFDGRELAFSGRAPGENNYHLFRVNVDGSNPCDAARGVVTEGPCQITMGPNDEVYPLYIPGGRLFFVTNQNVEGTEVPQFRDEYERATTAQVATVSLDGSDQVLGPRNVSHRVAPTLLSDGRILLTEWRHLGDNNEGLLTIMNQDLTGVREGFGSEGKGLTNSYLRAREVSPGMLVTIGTSRDRTFQAGKILLVNLGGTDVSMQSEARSSATDLTPDVPGDRTPSFTNVGRYYDAVPVGDAAKQQFLVSWADGPVESEVLGMAMATPDFGIYLYDAMAKTRFPIVNEVGTWEVNPTLIAPHTEPPVLMGAFQAKGTQSTLISAINVYNSSLFSDVAAGSIKKVRLTEGFSSEEGVPNMFGLTEFDGQARLGEVDVQPDGSFKAVVPANTPIHIQSIDKYGLAIHSEPVWIQGRPGEARVCGGCHENRTESIQLAPGSSNLQALGAAQIDYAGLTRQQRASTTYTADKVMGVPWDKAIQPIFDAHCVDCHDGSPGAANPSYSLTDLTDMTMFSFTFNLTSTPVTLSFGQDMYTYDASYVSMMGPSMALREKQVMVTSGTIKTYIDPGSSRTSVVIQMLNPPARYPNIDMNDRAFGTAPQHPAEITSYNGHNGADAKYQLTTDEYYLLGLSADNGGQYYSRENAPGGGY